MKDGSYKSFLVASKSRVSPTKVLSIVRLELCAAVLGARLANFIKKEIRFNIEQMIYVVDSQVVRCMIRSEAYGFNTFIAIRIGEIQEITNTEDWYWVAGNRNVADWITRGKNPHELHHDSYWQIGPPFMYSPISCWPIEKTEDIGNLPEKKINVTATDLENGNKFSVLI